MTTTRPAAVALVLALACGGARPAAEPAPASRADDAISELLTAALEADARLETADSLYEPEAVIIAGGRRQYAPPRFTGLAPGGAVAIVSSRVEVRGTLAWAQVEYRWLSTAAGLAREGWATFVVAQNDKGAWRIRHAHSSSPDGPDPAEIRAAGRP